MSYETYFMIFGKAPKVTHVMFADDIMIFGKATMKEMQAMDQALNLYSSWSGQCVNKLKSGLLFSSNTQASEVDQISKWSGYGYLRKDALYLGSPLWPERGRVAQYRYIVEKMKERLNSWKINTLTQAGRTVLIKSVLATIPGHVMSTSLIPKDNLEANYFCSEQLLVGRAGGQEKDPLLQLEHIEKL